MRIGFDITAQYVAQGGVFYYDHNLIKALLALDSENEYLLLDYHPLHGGYTDPHELHELQEMHALPRVKVAHVRGLRHRRLSRVHAFQKGGLRVLAWVVDGVLMRPWAWAARAVMKERLRPILDGVDVFHSSDVLLWAQPGACNVITIYDLTALLYPQYHTPETLEMQRRKFQFAQNFADAVVAISEATRQDIIAYLDIEPERVHVIHGGVGSQFHPIDDRVALEEKLSEFGLIPDGYLLHVGTLEPRKNLVRLIEAYAQARKARPRSLPPLVLVGAPGWNYRQLFERIEALGLEEHVRYLGRISRDDLPFLYAGAVLFVYPSLYEGFGLPPLEAMACGTPAVVSDISSLPEVVGDAAVLVDPLSVEALTSAMLRLIDSRSARQALKQRGLARAAMFTWERAAQKMLHLYSSRGVGNPYRSVSADTCSGPQELDRRVRGPK